MRNFRTPQIRIALFFIALLSCAHVQAADEPRYALVVGNSSYPTAPLRNPVNDARAIAAVLLEAGFVTTVVEDASAADFENVVNDFLESIPPESVGLLYYAGHGVQSGGRNFLLPTDFEPGESADVLASALSASDLVGRFHQRELAFGIFIFDACRDNPFTDDDAEIGKGLASMESDVGETLIAFSTQAGEVAADGNGPNSPYTSALVNELDQDGQDILDVFRSVRRSVRVWTGGKQRPFISASIERRFTFLEKADADADEIELGKVSADQVLAAVEAIWWQEIQGSQVADDFLNFTLRFPNSKHYKLAKWYVEDLKTRGIVASPDLSQFNIAEELRDENGLSSGITSCDITAGDPNDPRRVTQGVPWGLVNIRYAIRDCAAALAENPGKPRLLHQFGRILDIQNRHDTAEDFYQLAAAQNYSASLVNIGFLYVTGKGRERDYEKAMEYYAKAAELGNLRARTNIGEMFQRGWHVEKNPDEAVLWFSLAADSGWPNALDALGNMYRRGPDDSNRGPKKDSEKAARHYERAAKLGHTNAMNNLGRLHLSGDLGEPDLEQGISWLTQASNSGNRFAPFNLGRLYRDGKLVKRDYSRAIQEFKKSMDLGFAPARIALGRMYKDGNGVEKDAEEAAFHFVVASKTFDKKRPAQETEALDRLKELNIPDSKMVAIIERAENWVRLNGV